MQAFYDTYQINRIYEVYSRLVFNLFVIVPFFKIVLMLMLMFLSIVRIIKFYSRQYILSVG